MTSFRTWQVVVLWFVLSTTSFVSSTSDPSLLQGKNMSLIRTPPDMMKKLRESNPNVLRITTHSRTADQSGCNQLRSKRFISDGMCNSPKPVFDTICAEWCWKPLPPARNITTTLDYANQLLSYHTNQQQGTNKSMMEKWKCETDSTKRRKVKLQCKDGTRIVYHVRVVTSCKCSKAEKRNLSSIEKSRRLFDSHVENKQRLN